MERSREVRDVALHSLKTQLTSNLTQDFEPVSFVPKCQLPSHRTRLPFSDLVESGVCMQGSEKGRGEGGTRGTQVPAGFVRVGSFKAGHEGIFVGEVRFGRHGVETS